MVEIWSAPTPVAMINAVCPVPGSKSESNRALVLGALGDGPSRLSGVLEARDTELMIAGLRHLGVRIQLDHDEAVVTPPEHFVPAKIDCGLAGTVARFLPPLAALSGGECSFFGDPKMSERPIAPLLDGLRQLGASCSSEHVPFSISAPDGLTGREVRIDSSGSSQFISGLLLSAARFPNGLVLHHVGDSVPSLPHIEMSVSMLAQRGVRVSNSGMTWTVEPGTISSLDQRIEPDLSNAAAFLLAGVITGGRVTVPAWPSKTTQPGDLIRGVLDKVGAHSELTKDGLSAWSSEDLSGVDLDMSSASELTPVVAALAVFCNGTTRITGVGHIRGHETNRIEAIVDELNAIGVTASELADGIQIEGIGSHGSLSPRRPFKTYADHRMVHLGALLALKCSNLEVEDPKAASKTMPDFVERWTKMVNAE